MKIPLLIAVASLLLCGAGCSSSNPFAVSTQNQAYVIDGMQQSQISSQGLFQSPSISADIPSF